MFGLIAQFSLASAVSCSVQTDAVNGSSLLDATRPATAAEFGYDTGLPISRT